MVIVEARLIWMCSGKGDKGGNERSSKEESVKSQQAVVGKEAWSLEIILSKLFNTDEEIQGQEVGRGLPRGIHLDRGRCLWNADLLELTPVIFPWCYFVLPNLPSQLIFFSISAIRNKADLGAKEMMLSNCGAGEESWESLGLQGDQTSHS